MGAYVARRYINDKSVCGSCATSAADVAPVKFPSHDAHAIPCQKSGELHRQRKRLHHNAIHKTIIT